MSILDQADNEFKQYILPELSNYKNNGNGRHLIAANNSINSVLSIFIPLCSISKEFDSFRLIAISDEQVNSFVGDAKLKIEELSNQLRTVQIDIIENKQINEQAKDTAQQQQSIINQNLQNWQQEFSKSEKHRDEVFSNKIDDIEMNASSEITRIIGEIESISGKKFRNFRIMLTAQLAMLKIKFKESKNYTIWQAE